MKNITRALLMGAALIAPASAGEMSLFDREALDAASAPALEAQRAAGVANPGFDEVERSSLASAQLQAQDLDQLRAGDLTDHDLKIIGITLLIVLVIAIIA